MITLLISACLFSACISEKTASPAPVTTTLSAPSPGSTQSLFISFENARDNLGVYPDTDPRTNPDGIQKYIKKNESIVIRFIQGMNTDTSGNARTWAFGVQTGKGNELRAYDVSGWTIIPLNESFSSGEIDMSRITTPAKLFDINRGAISQVTSSGPVLRNIELVDGIYTITFKGTSRMLKFNATTGEAIDKNM